MSTVPKKKRRSVARLKIKTHAHQRPTPYNCKSARQSAHDMLTEQRVDDMLNECTHQVEVDPATMMECVAIIENSERIYIYLEGRYDTKRMTIDESTAKKILHTGQSIGLKLRCYPSLGRSMGIVFIGGA